MDPVEHRFIAIPQFIEIVQKYSSTAGWVFRGQDCIDWPLCPKAGRPEYYLKATEPWAENGQTSSDLGRFKAWRKYATAFTTTLPQNDFHCLAFAQHYGLATRLLDWSTNPLVALFFAVEQNGANDGAVFCHFASLIIDPDESQLTSPFGEVPLFVPSPIDRRIVAQSGVFTCHTHPQIPLEGRMLPDEYKVAGPEGIDLVVLRVDARCKSIYQRQLAELGVSRKTLFPDLEGLSSFVDWETKRMTSFRARKPS